jgi:hypothetical protein
MQLIATRKYWLLDAETLTERAARDTLLKVGETAFLLHMILGGDCKTERLVQLDARSALLWINQTADDYGLNWE